MPVYGLHDAAVPPATLQREAIAQLAVLVFQLMDLVAVALVSVVDLFFVEFEQGELAVLLSDEGGGASEAPVPLDGSMDFRLWRFVSLFSTIDTLAGRQGEGTIGTHRAVLFRVRCRVYTPGWNGAGDTITQRLCKVCVHSIKLAVVKVGGQSSLHGCT